MPSVGESAQVSGANQNQLADMLHTMQNRQQVNYLMTVAHLLNASREDVEKLWKDGNITMDQAEKIHRGAMALNWKPFTETFQMEPHAFAVAYWMANHVVNKRLEGVAFRITQLEQTIVELGNRVLILEQKSK